MKLGKVIGSVWATRKSQCLQGQTFLVVQSGGEEIVAADHVGAGVGDRHVDIFWGRWTLNFNLKTDAYCNRFLDAYGRENIEPELLRTVAACEVFL